MRPRLSRTFSRGRWPEYGRFLRAGLESGYRVVSLESWISEPDQDDGRRTLILRHDVDQHPRSALRMAGIEDELGLRSSWYFRWRTAHPAVISELRDHGFEVGLHYETLTRMALERGLKGAPGPALVTEGRQELKAEIAAFSRRFGPIASVAPHGDSRVPDVRNAELLHDQGCADYGIRFDGNEAMRGRKLGYWLTDRTAAEGGWRDGTDPVGLFGGGVSPILALTHPNNWVSGPGLWWDRALHTMLPSGSAAGQGTPRALIRTGSDRPPP